MYLAPTAVEQHLAGHPARIAAVAVPRVRRASFDFAEDLAEEIGTARWWRGLGLMLGLIALACAFWPRLAPPTLPAARLDATAREELRFREILPLAQGSPAGRKVPPAALVAPLANVPERPRIDLTTTLADGEGVARMLQRAGVGAGDAAGAAQLVAANVEHLRFQFGVADGSGNVRYLSASAVTDWPSVRTARIWLLMRESLPEPGLVSASYVLGDVTYTPTDHFRRSVYSATVALRNG